MEELELEFNEAAEAVQQNALKGTVRLDDKKMLELYGLYKVGTVGLCKESQPGFFNLKGRAKWTAWDHASKCYNSSEMAQIRYVELVKNFLGWSPSSSGISDFDANKSGTTEKSSLGSLSMGNVVSTLGASADEVEEENDLVPAFAWARDNDLVKLKSWLASASSNVNIQDDNGLTPLHWAVDRGHLPACSLLLDHGADPRLEDNEGSSCLEYAETCEHSHIVELINRSLHI